MKYCPITYEKISQKEKYSHRGLSLLSPKLTHLEPLALSAKELRQEAIARTGKMSIQGVQLKLSAQLKIKEGKFAIVDQFGHYILKPQSEYYLELPENEAVTMTMVKEIHLDVPLHGLILGEDQNWTYFIKRFDRIRHKGKIAVEDFSQLSQMTRDTKYNSSMEQVAKVISTFCTFPRIEALKLFKLTLFNFLVGNEDMHLKNFSLITRDKKVILSPPYDLLNTTIVLPKPTEELALPLNGKKNNLTRRDFFNYFADYLQLNQNTLDQVIAEFKVAIPRWKELLERSFLSKTMKAKYRKLLDERVKRMF